MTTSRPLGSSGMSASALGLGCNAFGTRIDADGARAVVHAALDEGVTFFDTADGYGQPFGTSETIIGDILRDISDRPLIATKGGANPAGFSEPPDASAKWLAKAVDDSLKRLRVERIDLYQVHFPDPRTPVAETIAAMDAMVREGKVGAIGCSQYSPEQLREARMVSERDGLARFETTQAECHLLSPRTETDMLAATLADLDMGLLPYFPLAGGLLTGKYAGGVLPEGSRFAKQPGMADYFKSEGHADKLQGLSAIATSRELTLPDLAVAWLLAQPQVACVIAGATKPEQVRANATSARVTLDAATLAEIDAVRAL